MKQNLKGIPPQPGSRVPRTDLLFRQGSGSSREEGLGKSPPIPDDTLLPEGTRDTRPGGWASPPLPYPPIGPTGLSHALYPTLSALGGGLETPHPGYMAPSVGTQRTSSPPNTSFTPVFPGEPLGRYFTSTTLRRPSGSDLRLGTQTQTQTGREPTY